MSYFKSNSLKITPSKNKRLYLDTNMIKEYHGTSMAGTDDFGQTKINQDSYLILTKLNNFINYNVFAVFDGHGLQGHLVSQFLVKYFTGFFKNNPQLTKCKDELQVFNLFLCNDYKIEMSLPICILLVPDLKNKTYVEQYSQILENLFYT